LRPTFDETNEKYRFFANFTFQSIGASMKFDLPIPISTIAAAFGLEIRGNSTLQASGINVIHRVEAGDITFVDIPKYYQKAIDSAATIIIINQAIDCPQHKALLITDQPFQVYNELVKEHRPFVFARQEIDPTARIGAGTIIEPNVLIGAHVTIGESCYIQGNAYIGPYTQIGNRVNIQAGALIGSDAFYFKKEDERYLKWHTGGRVIIADDVEIGAGSTVNRGVSSDTSIGEGTKIDCQVHIAHGVRIGKHCLIAAQTGISGKTIIGDGVVIYGQVGIAQTLKIGDRAIILAKSGVSKDLPANGIYFGYPASEARQKNKELAVLRQLPDWWKTQS